MNNIDFRYGQLHFREFRMDDYEDVHYYTVDPEVVKYVTFGPNSPEQTKDFLNRCIAGSNTVPRTRFDLAICVFDEKMDREIVIGGIGLFLGNFKSAELGYILSKDYWGRGIATEAARIMIKFGFDELDLHRIYATCNVLNRASARVLEKINMTREGILRDFLPIDGIWYNNYIYSILEDEI